MGLDISKITNEALKALAFINDENSDKILTEEEFSIFKAAAVEKLKAGELTYEDFNQAMGLYVSPESSEKKDKVEESEHKEKKLSKAEKQAATRAEEYILRKMDELILDNVSSEELLAELDKVLGEQANDPRYVALKQSIEEIQKLIPEYSSIKDIDKKHDAVIEKMKEAGLTEDVHKDILKGLEKQAEIELRTQAVIMLQTYYAKKVQDYAEIGMKRTDEEIMDEIKADIKNGKVTVNGQIIDFEDEYKDGFETFEKSYIMKEARKTVSQAIYGELDETKWRKVRKGAKEALIESEVYDKYIKEALNSKEGKITAQNQARENNVEKHKVQTEEEILKVLGKKNEVFEALVSTGLITKTEDGKYDLTVLSDIIGSYVGADNQLNRHARIDKAISEKLRTTGGLALKTQLDSLTEKEAMELVKLCGYDKEGKNWGKMLLGGALGFLVGAGSGAAAAATNPRQVVDATFTDKDRLEFNLNGVGADAVSDLKGIEGLQINPTGTGIQIIIESVDVIPIFFQASKHILATAVKTGLAGAALGLLQGMEDTGEIPVTVTQFENCSIEEYTERVKKETPKYAAALTALAYTFYDKDTQTWDVEGFKAFLNNAAGDGGKLNKNEFIGALKKIYTEPTEETTTDDDEQINTAVVTPHTLPGDTDEEDITYIHNRQYGDTWAGLVKAYYPELIDKCGGLYGKNGAIKRLQRELCTDENGVFNPSLFKDLISRSNLPAKIKLPSKIDDVERKDGKVKPATAEELNRGKGTGKSGMKMIGRDEIRVTQIPGTNVWKAVDGSEDTVSPQYGSSPREAVQKLQNQTGKEYDKILDGNGNEMTI